MEELALDVPNYVGNEIRNQILSGKYQILRQQNRKITIFQILILLLRI